MAASRLVVISLMLAVLISTCNAGLLESLLEWLFGFKPGKRSLQEALTTYLDSIFPKDDIDSDLLKHLFMVYSEDDDTNFASPFVGLEENV